MRSRSLIVALVLISGVLISSTGHGLPIGQDLTISLAPPDPMTQVEFTAFQLIPVPESGLIPASSKYDFMLPGLSSRSTYERIFQYATDHGTPMDPMFISNTDFSNGFIAKVASDNLMLPGLSSRSTYERAFQYTTDRGIPMYPIFMSATGFSNGFIAREVQFDSFPGDPILPSFETGSGTSAADFALLTVTRPIYAFDMPILGASQITSTVVPEPATFLLLVAGIGGAAIISLLRAGHCMH